MCLSAITMLKLVGMHRPNNGAGHRASGPKSAEFLLHLLKNTENNAELKGLDVDSLAIEHILVNKASNMRHRTYRAHGQINLFMSSLCPTEMIPTRKEQVVPKPEEEIAEKEKISQKKIFLRITQKKLKNKSL